MNDQVDLKHRVHVAGRDPALRDGPRFEVVWEAAVQCPDWESAEKIAAANVSSGGMFLRTERQFEPGARVQVTLALPDECDVKLLATVRHVLAPGHSGSRPPGIGVEVDAECRNELMAVVEIARLRQGKPPSSLPTPAPAHQTPLRAATSTGRPRVVVLPRGKVAEIVGIDFGVSYSGLAAAVDDTVYTVPDAFGRAQYPSLVSFPEEGAEPVVGWEARKLQAERPDRTVTSIKRVLGRVHEDPQIGGFLYSLPYQTAAGPNGAVLLQVGGMTLAVPQVCALILRHLKEQAEVQLGTTVRRAVLTHPVTYSAAQMEALQQAERIAEMDVAALISEPLAGALAYGHGQAPNSETVAVYDFGGGTFDFTVLEVSASSYRTLASAGDSWLGGDDFDLAVAQAVANTFWRSTRVELQKRVIEWQRLLIACERAKRRLSVDEQTVIDLPQIVAAPQPVDLQQPLDRAALERLCTSLVERTLEVCEQALQGAGLGVDRLDQVILVGGTTRIPFVRAALERYFGRRLVDRVSPDDAVALGAGMYAARLAGHPAYKARSITP